MKKVWASAGRFSRRGFSGRGFICRGVQLSRCLAAEGLSVEVFSCRGFICRGVQF